MHKRILHISKFYEPYKGGIEDVCRTVVDIISEQKPNCKQVVLCFNDTAGALKHQPKINLTVH